MKFIITIIILCLCKCFLYSQKPYRGAEYRTIDDFTYGRFEVRMKTAVGSGIVSSFFTIDDYWANGLSSTENWREIDFEALGNQGNAIQTNIITAYETHHEELTFTPFYPHESFHTYAFEWTPQSILFFVDDQLVRQDNNNYISSLNTGQKIMMNIWQPIWESWVGEFNASILPAYVFYDWVKYYTYTPDNGTYGTQNDFTFSWSDEFNYFDNQTWEKATHTWSANNAQFVQQNAVLQDGYLILCLTDNLSFGYLGDALSIVDFQKPNNDKTIIIKPNPFNSSFILNMPDYDTEIECKIFLYNINGTEVYSRTQNIVKGELKTDLNKNNIASGLYFGVLKTKHQSHSFKATYLR